MLVYLCYSYCIHVMKKNNLIVTHYNKIRLIAHNGFVVSAKTQAWWQLSKELNQTGKKLLLVNLQVWVV